MELKTLETAGQTLAANAGGDSVEVATKPRRPRRMAREADGAVPPGAEAASVNEASSVADVVPAPRAPSKIDAVLALLRREDGATLAEMVEATGWLPHTTRAALTGLRKKGHVLARDKRGNVTCYRITGAR